MIYIYALIDPRDNQIKYVGKTKNTKRRLYEHLCEIKSKRNNKKVNWLKCLNKLDLLPELFILDEVREQEWQFWEQYWISQCKNWGFKLKSQSKGGEGPADFIAWKISKSLTGHKQSNETIQKRQNKLKIFWETEKGQLKRIETNSKISSGLLKSTKYSDKCKEPEFKAKLKKLRKEESKTRGLHGAVLLVKNGARFGSQFKAIAQYNLRGELIKEYYNSKEIKEVFGKKPDFSGVCTNISRTYHGYIFRYINPSSNQLPNTKESVLETINHFLSIPKPSGKAKLLVDKISTSNI